MSKLSVVQLVKHTDSAGHRSKKPPVLTYHRRWKRNTGNNQAASVGAGDESSL